MAAHKSLALATTSTELKNYREEEIHGILFRYHRHIQKHGDKFPNLADSWEENMRRVLKRAEQLGMVFSDTETIALILRLRDKDDADA